MVKTFKNLLLENRGYLLAESLQKSSGMGGLPNLLKLWSYIDIWPFTGRSSLLPYACMGKCWEFLTTSPLEPLGQCCSNFIWSLPGAGEWKNAQIVAIYWQRWLPCPYMAKTLQNLLLEYLGCLVAESLHKSSGTGGLPKLLKWLSYIDIWPFYGEVKFASVCICMGPIHLYGKNVDNFKWLLWSLWVCIAQISCGASLGQNNERLLKCAWSIDQNGCHAHMW